MISAPAGMAPLAVTLWILSLSTMTTALGIVAWPSHNLPNLIALVAASAFRETARQSARRNIPSRSMAPLAAGRLDVEYHPCRWATIARASRCATLNHQLSRGNQRFLYLEREEGVSVTELRATLSVLWGCRSEEHTSELQSHL